MEPKKMFINGKWVEAVSGKTFDDMNPYTGDIYAQVPKADADDADRAMASAFDARKPWSTTPPIERSRILFKAADLLEKKREEFARVLCAEGGSTVGKAMFEIFQTLDLLRTAGADCKRLLGETFHTDPGKLSMTLLKPRGTILAISPWNFPLILSMYKVAYSLATGNTVVYKPSSKTPVIGLKIGELFEEAGLLPGALNILTGSGGILGDILIDDDRCSFVTFTGGTRTGRHVAQRAAAKLKEYTLELGGNNPLIILGDADMEYAVSAAAFGAFLHQGQICIAVGRIIVEKSIEDEFAEKLAAKAASLPVGDPADPSTVIGPLISDEQVKKVDAHVKDAVEQGAGLLTGGTFKDRLYSPTVVKHISEKMKIYNEETFGPVASIIGVRDEKEALAVANNSVYGLSSGIITRDLEKAMYLAEGLDAGMVHVNDASINADALCPFGGCKWSGQGREGGHFSVDELTESKWVTIQKQKRAFPF